MPPAHLARLTTLVATLLACAGGAWADVGGTLSLQTDARERGMSYSANRPSAQAGLAWDGLAGWYAGAQLSQARFSQRRSAAVQAYAGRVFAVSPGLDGEVGLVAHAYQQISHYDYQEVYAGLLGERWNLRAYYSPDYYGVGQRSLYTELNGRWPLAPGWALLGHVGLLHVRGGRSCPMSSRTATPGWTCAPAHPGKWARAANCNSSGSQRAEAGPTAGPMRRGGARRCSG